MADDSPNQARGGALSLHFALKFFKWPNFMFSLILTTFPSYR